MTLLEFIKQHVRVYDKDKKKLLYEHYSPDDTNAESHLFLYNLTKDIFDYYLTEDVPTVEAGLVDEPEDLLHDILIAAYLTYNKTTYYSCSKKLQYVDEHTYEISIGHDYKTERYTDIDLR